MALVPLVWETLWSIYCDFVYLKNDISFEYIPLWFWESITVLARLGLLLLLWRSPRDERCFILKNDVEDRGSLPGHQFSPSCRIWFFLKNLLLIIIIRICSMVSFVWQPEETFPNQEPRYGRLKLTKLHLIGDGLCCPSRYTRACWDWLVPGPSLGFRLCVDGLVSHLGVRLA